MHLSVVATVFPIVFLAELPDKTMFASLVLATRGRPLAVWAGASAAFAVHVVIAVSIGVALFKVLPHRAVEVVVAALFAAGAVYSWVTRNVSEEAEEAKVRSNRAVVTTTAGVIFLAEWGDLTQILTANLAAKYGAPLSVAVGSVAALWAVAAVAVTSGKTLLRLVSVQRVRQVTAVILLGLAAYAAWSAAR